MTRHPPNASDAADGRWPHRARYAARVASVGVVAVALLLGGLAGAAAAQPPTPIPPTPASPTPTAGPSAAPGTPAAPASPAAPADVAPAPWDIPGQITAAINTWLAGLVESAAAPAAELAATVLAPPQLVGFDRLHAMWSGSAALANTLYVLLVLAAGVVVMGHESLQTRTALKEVAPRLVIGLVAANLSWELVGIAAQLAGGLTVAVAGDGLSPGAVLGDQLRNTLTGGPLFLIIIGLVAAVMMFVLLLCMIVVFALLIVLIAGAPLALTTHALPQTEWIAHLWWKATFGCLAIPTLQALIMAAVVRVVLAPGGFGLIGLPTPGGVVNLLVLIALLYLMIKVPFWVLRGALARGGGRSRLVSIVQSVLVYKGLQAAGIPLLSRRSGSTESGSGRAGGGRSGGARTRRPRPRPRPGPGGPGGGGAAAIPADPYRSPQVGKDGQYRLPLPGVLRTRRPRTSAPPTDTSASPSAAGGAGRVYRGRQLALPLRDGWPEQRPVPTRSGQYRLPIELPRQPRPAPAEPPAPRHRRVGSHQLLLLHRSGRIPRTLTTPWKATR